MNEPNHNDPRTMALWALQRVTELNEALVQSSRTNTALRLIGLEWDVYLTTGNETRDDLRKAAHLDAAAKFRAVTLPMPRSIWRATAIRDDVPVLDVLFDATDIDTAHGLAQIVFHDALVREFIKSLADVDDIEVLPFKNSVKNILRWVKRNP